MCCHGFQGLFAIITVNLPLWQVPLHWLTACLHWRHHSSSRWWDHRRVARAEEVSRVFEGFIVTNSLPPLPLSLSLSLSLLLRTIMWCIALPKYIPELHVSHIFHSGLHEYLKLKVAMPYLFGAPASLDSLRSAIKVGGGFIERVHHRWDMRI